MSFHPLKLAEKAKGMFAISLHFSFFLVLTSAIAAATEEAWTCEETAFYGVYEDTSRTNGEVTLRPKTLKWINENTIGFDSITLDRINPSSEIYFNQASESTLHVYQTERPYLVVLAQPQVWMNKFGNLRVRFYRCTP